MTWSYQTRDYTSHDPPVLVRWVNKAASGLIGFIAGGTVGASVGMSAYDALCTHADREEEKRKASKG